MLRYFEKHAGSLCEGKTLSIFSDIWQFLQHLSSDIDFCLTELNKAGLQSASVPKTMSSWYVFHM